MKAKTLSNVTFRIMTIDDFDDFLYLKSDYANIAWGGFMTKPDRTQFYKWYEKAIQSETRFMYIVHCNNKPIAYFSVEKTSNDEYELANVGVIGTHTGNGLGTYLLKCAEDIALKNGAKTLSAWVSENNIASYKMFLKLGYEKQTTYDVRHLPLLGGEHRFFKYVKKIS